jgi:uncharacterized glyoxalase superfamily protein PhnB
MAITEVRPELFYRDPPAALAWLDRAFGLKTELAVRDGTGAQVFARVSGGVAVVGEIPGSRQSPASMGGLGSQQVMVTLDDGIEAHFESARAAGARIEQALRREFFGLTYTAADSEGHLWSFVQAVAEPMPPPEGWTVRLPGQDPAEET